MSSAEHLRRTTRVVVAGVVALAAGLVAAPSASADEVYPRPAGTTHRLPRPRLGPRQRDVAVRQPRWGAGREDLAADPGALLHRHHAGQHRLPARSGCGSPPWAPACRPYRATGLRVTWDLTNSSVLPDDAATASPSPDGESCPPRRSWAPRPGSSCSTSRPGPSTWKAYATALGPQHRGLPQLDQRHRHDAARQHHRSSTAARCAGTLIGSAGAESLVPVVALPLESYLLSVVPSESPASWPAAALSAQAVAARSFAEYHRRYLPISSAWYDVYDDTRSQVFAGTKVGSVTKEYASSTAAVNATAKQAMFYDGAVVYAQFCSSSGGYTNTGSKPYLKAVPDPWDAVASNPNNTWQKTVAITTIEKAYPSIGRLEALRITSRTGLGDEGGRVLGITVQGSSASVATTGTGFASKVGLKHHWFTPQLPGSSPSYPRDVTGDGHADVVAVEASGGALRVYPTTGAGAWKTPDPQRVGVDRLRQGPHGGHLGRRPDLGRDRPGHGRWALPAQRQRQRHVRGLGAHRVGLDGPRPGDAGRRLRRRRPHRPGRAACRRRAVPLLRQRSWWFRARAPGGRSGSGWDTLHRGVQPRRLQRRRPARPAGARCRRHGLPLPGQRRGRLAACPARPWRRAGSSTPP